MRHRLDRDLTTGQRDLPFEQLGPESSEINGGNGTRFRTGLISFLIYSKDEFRALDQLDDQTDAFRF